jgi:hypothetical protein
MRISETRDNAWRFQFGTLEVSTEKVKDSLLRIIKLTDHLSIISLIHTPQTVKPNASP